MKKPLNPVILRFGRAGAIALACFVPAANRSALSRAWSIVSRFTWELPQQVLGVLYAQLINLGGGVEKVTVLKGALLVRTNFGGGMALGNIITSSSAALDKHEWGHTIQSRWLGPLYLPVIGIPSLLRATILWALERARLINKVSSAEYYRFYTEASANALAEKYWDQN